MSPCSNLSSSQLIFIKTKNWQDNDICQNTYFDLVTLQFFVVLVFNVIHYSKKLKKTFIIFFFKQYIFWYRNITNPLFYAKHLIFLLSTENENHVENERESIIIPYCKQTWIDWLVFNSVFQPYCGVTNIKWLLLLKW